MNYQVSLKEKRILPIAEGLTATLFKASSLLCDFSWSLLWFFPLWCWIKISMNWYSGTSSCAFAERVGLIYSLINNTTGGKPREVRAFSLSTCLWLWVSLTVGKHSSGLCWTAGCQHTDKLQGSGKAGNFLLYPIWVRSPWVRRKSLRHKIWTLTFLTE